MSFEMLKIGALFLNILVLSVVAAEADKTVAAVNLKVGVVLDLNDVVGKMGLSCINMTLSDFYANQNYYKTKLILNPMDSNGTNYCWCNYNRFVLIFILIFYQFKTFKKTRLRDLNPFSREFHIEKMSSDHLTFFFHKIRELIWIGIKSRIDQN